MNRPTHVAWIVAGLSLLLANSAQAGWQVWATTETRRVLREDPAEKPTAVRLACARNEWRGFQVLVRSDAALRGIRIEPGDLIGPDGAVLASSQSRLFRQHQLHLTDPSYRNDFFRSGWYPDALIPASHPVTGKPLAGARFVKESNRLPMNPANHKSATVAAPAILLTLFLTAALKAITIQGAGVDKTVIIDNISNRSKINMELRVEYPAMASTSRPEGLLQRHPDARLQALYLSPPASA